MGGSRSSEILGLVLERCFPFYFRPAEPLTQCPARVRETPVYEAQNCRVFVVVLFRPADALSPEPGGDQGTLCARNVVQGYVRACVSSFVFVLCVIFDLILFRLNSSPPGWAVGDDTFHFGY